LPTDKCTGLATLLGRSRPLEGRIVEARSGTQFVGEFIATRHHFDRSKEGRRIWCAMRTVNSPKRFRFSPMVDYFDFNRPNIAPEDAVLQDTAKANPDPVVVKYYSWRFVQALVSHE
jgi:hypothetical protein